MTQMAQIEVEEEAEVERIHHEEHEGHKDEL
jgi:hypothetical protein